MKKTAKLEENGLFKLPTEIRTKVLRRVGMTEDEYRVKLRQQLKRDAEHEKALANGEQVHGWSTKKENPGWSDDKIVGEVVTDDDRITEQSYATPGQASAAGAILTVEHLMGGDRYAAHVFDIEGGIAFIDHGWFGAFPGSGQPCHQVSGYFKPYDGSTWIAVGTELGDIIIRRYDGRERPDGPRDKAWKILEHSLGIAIPNKLVTGQLGTQPLFDQHQEMKAPLAQLSTMHSKSAVASIDPITDSLICLMVVVLPKGRSPNFPVALGIAQCAAKFTEANVGGKTTYLVGFAKTPEDAARASALLDYARNWKGVQVFCSGKRMDDQYRIAKVLRCYLDSTACKDYTAHCVEIINDPYSEVGSGFTLSLSIPDKPAPKMAVEVDRYSFPCRYVRHRTQLQKDHPASIPDQIQAAAVAENCAWCPNFDPSSWQKAGSRMVYVDFFS